MNAPSDFDRHRYERPYQKWICGRHTEGKSCRVGPDGEGRCRATFECVPALEIKPGENKGRYNCTRPAEYGGPCKEGPKPDGTCCRAIPKCQPVRSWRSRRGVFTVALTSGTLAVLLVLLNGTWRQSFINPGPISTAHSSVRFTRMQGGTETEGCVACHTNAMAPATGWLGEAFQGHYGMFAFRKLTASGAPALSDLDRACLRCHTGHAFHQPNVMETHSCFSCHREHRGDALLDLPGDAACASCHNNASVMEASAQKGLTLAASVFEALKPKAGTPFMKPRPKEGYTKVFPSFAGGHPDFQVHTEKLQETNTLRFNHQRHFAADIPLVQGKKLECASCHQPKASGAYHEKPTYEANCKACHSLQFDVRNPSLLIPHGEVSTVRSFLGSLPEQYADYAKTEKGITQQREQDDFVIKQLTALRKEMSSEQNLEAKIFYSAQRWAPGPDTGGVGPAGKPVFYGCAFCHEVTQTSNAVPAVTPPIIPDRWLSPGSFNHAKHTALQCGDCHDAKRSSKTSDIILPRQASCVNCHSAYGGVVNTCTVCHTFHRASE